MIETTKWYTVQEVAKQLGVTGGRVRQFIVEGRITGQKFGNSWAIAESEVQRFQSLERQPGNPKQRKTD